MSSRCQPQLTATTGTQLVYQPRFKWQSSLLLILVGLGLVIGADFGLKTLMVENQLAASSTDATLQLSFNNPLLEQKLAQYQIDCVQQLLLNNIDV